MIITYLCFFPDALLDILSQSEKDFSDELNCEYPVSDSDCCRVRCDCCGVFYGGDNKNIGCVLRTWD